MAALALVASALASAENVNTPAALASNPVSYTTLGYPYASEPCEHSPYTRPPAPAPANYCLNYDWGPTPDTTKGWTESDSYDPATGYGYENCTDYVAWQLAQYGVPSKYYTGLQYAYEWEDNAQGEGIATGSTPEVDSVAVAPSTPGDPDGHVAFVDSVNSDGTITVSEYNYDEAGDGDIQTGTPSSMGFTGYIYYAGLMTNPPGGSRDVNSFQAIQNVLYTVPDDSTSPVDTAQGMKPGTSPSIAVVSGDDIEAFQANTGDLFTYDSTTGSPTDTDRAMGNSTSPSITALATGGYEIAMQDNNGNLYVYGSDGTYDTGLGMYSGTNPSITATPGGGWRAAFEANTGYLYTYDASSGYFDTGMQMMVGTSPSIVTLQDGDYQTAFQGTNGDLQIYDSDSESSMDTGQGMASGTSPSMTVLSNGETMEAFQAVSDDDLLYTYNSSTGSSTDTLQGMYPGTSPAIAADSGSNNATVAFEANTANLFDWDYDASTNSGSSFDTGQGMQPGTNPGVTEP